MHAERSCCAAVAHCLRKILTHQSLVTFKPSASCRRPVNERYSSAWMYSLWAGGRVSASPVGAGGHGPAEGHEGVPGAGHHAFLHHAGAGARWRGRGGPQVACRASARRGRRGGAPAPRAPGRSTEVAARKRSQIVRLQAVKRKLRRQVADGERERDSHDRAVGDGRGVQRVAQHAAAYAQQEGEVRNYRSRRQHQVHVRHRQRVAIIHSASPPSQIAASRLDRQQTGHLGQRMAFDCVFACGGPPARAPRSPYVQVQVHKGTRVLLRSTDPRSGAAVWGRQQMQLVDLHAQRDQTPSF